MAAVGVVVGMVVEAVAGTAVADGMVAIAELT
jgi:hypothetical protein